MDRLFELPDGFVSLGWYPPTEARHLLDSLSGAGLEIYAEFDDGISGRPPLEFPLGGFGASASVLVAVAQSDVRQAEPILREWYGDQLPAEVQHELVGSRYESNDELAAAQGDPVEDIRQLQARLQQRTEEIRALEDRLGQAPAGQKPALQEALEKHLQQAEEELRLLDQLASEA